MSVLHESADDSAEGTALYLADAAATESLGHSLAPAMEKGLVIWLSGDLGAGKTTLTRGLLRALGHTGSVKSPTYTLIEPYTISRITLYHFDFYRFTHPDEFLDAGLEEYFQGDGACLVEWADKALPYVPQPDVEIQLLVEGDGRRARIVSRSPRGRTCLSRATFSA